MSSQSGLKAVLWHTGGGAVMSAVAGLILVLMGILAGRPLIVALGAPLLLSPAWTWLERPRTGAMVSIGEATLDHETRRVVAPLHIAAPRGVAATRLSVGAPGHRTIEVVVRSVDNRTVELSTHGARTGRRNMFGGFHQETTADRLLRSEPQKLGPIETLVLPATRPLSLLPLPFRLQGMTGPHGSPRLGDGGDLHDVSLFRPGDPLRRIDWKVTARRAGQGRGARTGVLTDLYVTRTHATADASVVLVIDSRDDIGPDLLTWAGYADVHPEDPTSLDVARTAAASLASRYLAAGDRVAVVDLGRPWRQVRPAGGGRHLYRLVHQLAEATPVGEPRRLVRAPPLPAGALVIVLSTFLDDQSAETAAMWRRAGHRVIAIDVLPDPRIDGLRRRETLAYRVIAMERADRLRALQRSGVELVSGDHETGPGASSRLATDLAATSRMERRR